MEALVINKSFTHASTLTAMVQMEEPQTSMEEAMACW
jgi:hypothetical protein